MVVAKAEYSVAEKLGVIANFCLMSTRSADGLAISIAIWRLQDGVLDLTIASNYWLYLASNQLPAVRLRH